MVQGSFLSPRSSITHNIQARWQMDQVITWSLVMRWTVSSFCREPTAAAMQRSISSHLGALTRRAGPLT